MRDLLCHAFCDDVTVTTVPAGLAVSTAFRRDDGDKVSFYVIEDGDGRLHLEDDGATIPLLEGAGVDFDTETRRRAFDKLLGSVNGYYDADEATIRTHPFDKKDLPSLAIDFVAVMLRMNDFLLLTQEKVVSTFREDAARLIRSAVGGRALIRESEPVSRSLSEVTPDMVIQAAHRPPVAVFFGNSTGRVHDAIFLHQTALYEVRQELSVVALLEQDNSIPADLRRRASNRLSTVPVFRQDEEAAVGRIAREAIGNLA